MRNSVLDRRSIQWVPLLLAVSLSVVIAADDSKTPKVPKEKTKEPVVAPITPEREQGALAFVEKHHPELSSLLSELKTHKVKQYERAVRELAAARERLELLQTKDAALYELELASWKTKSRIQLLTAKLSMNDQTASKAELRIALEEQYELRKKIARHERDLLSDRVKKLDREMSEADARREAAIQKQFETLTSAFSGEKRSKESDNRKNLP